MITEGRIADSTGVLRAVTTTWILTAASTFNCSPLNVAKVINSSHWLLGKTVFDVDIVPFGYVFHAITANRQSG